MKRETAIRAMKRRSMRRKGNTFTQRVQTAITLGKPVQSVVFRLQEPPVKM